MFVFGIDIPLPEILFIVVILMAAGLVFLLVQMRHVNRHMTILEKTTLEIRKFEEQEMEQVREFQTDIKKLEADEAELFVTRIVPTVAKLENYVAAELLNNKDPEVIKQALVRRGINSELATKVVNSMTFYMDYFQKLPDRHVSTQLKTAEQIKVAK